MQDEERVVLRGRHGAVAIDRARTEEQRKLGPLRPAKGQGQSWGVRKTGTRATTSPHRDI